MKKYTQRFSLSLVLIALLGLVYWFTQNQPQNQPQDQQASNALRASSDSGDRASSHSYRRRNIKISTSGITIKTGTPTATKPFPRGKNGQRPHGPPVTSQLPDNIKNGSPAVMAMLPADGRLELLPEEIDLHTLKSRRMVLDTEALDRVVNAETNQLIVPTTDSTFLDLRITKVKTRSAQTHTLFGRIIGEEDTSNVQIVYHDGIVHGTVARYDIGQHLEYRILADGHMMVRELDVASIPWRCGNPNEGAEAADNAGANSGHTCGPSCAHGDEEITIMPVESADTSGWTTIDVVMGYGAQARLNQGGTSAMEAHIIAAVDRMTNAFDNSLVTNTELMLLGTIEDPDYLFPGSNANEMGGVDELGDLSDGNDGNLDAVTDYATSLGADLIGFVCNSSQNGTAGIANRPGRYSITSRTAMTSSNLTFCHELGHNLGARHSWGDSGDTNTSTSRFGLRFETSGGSKRRTIMAYNNSPSYSASRIPYYANPNVSYLGTPTGLDDGSNQTGNGDIDPDYISGGFDGSNSSLGARNAEMFLVQSGSNGVVYASNRATRTGLGITSPTNGAQWPAGSTQTISFTGGDMEYTADIDLYKGGIYQDSIADDIDAIDHSFSWEIPLAQAGGNNYQIRVTLTHTGTNATSFTESGFFVIQGITDIILESPIGGESLTRNTKKNITWSSSYGGNVHIEYIKGADSPVTIIANTPDDGTYEWTIPYDFAADNDYIIRVTSDVSPFDTSQSASTFSIVAPSNNLLITNLDTNPGFTTSGEFEYGVPQGPAGEEKGNGASSAYTGSNIYDTNLSDTSYGYSSLTTFAIDCSNHTNITLEFWAYIMVWTGYYVTFEISTDNSNWTELETVGAGIILNQSWEKYPYDITAYAAGKSTVYIRWSMSGSGSQMTSGGLAIDDITITGDFIPADNISLTSPDGGETWPRQATRQITWFSSLSGYVDIELFKGGQSEGMIATDTPNDGSYNWLLPVTLAAGSDYKVKIMSSDNASKIDESISNFSISVPTSTIFSSNLNTDPGLNISGDFQYGEPGGSNIASSPHTGTNMYDTNLTGTAYNGTLTTMVLNCSTYTDVSLNFWAHRFMNTGYTVRFEVSNDNENWTLLHSIPGFSSYSSSDFQWKEFTYNISNTADGESTVYVRWSLSGSGGAWNGQGLAIDDITISGNFTPSPPTYDSWAQGPAAEVDSNGDGIENGIAWLLGLTNPTSDASSVRPTIDNTTVPNYMVFTYRRNDLANNDPNTIIGVEYGSDLVGWAAAVHDNDNIKITEDNDFYGNGIDRVRVEMKKSLATGNKLFTRIKVQVTE